MNRRECPHDVPWEQPCQMCDDEGVISPWQRKKAGFSEQQGRRKRKVLARIS
jgi:hypothetical protein